MPNSLLNNKGVKKSITTERDFFALIEEEHKKHTGTIDFSNVIFNIPVTPALFEKISNKKGEKTEVSCELNFENAIFLKEVDFTNLFFKFCFFKIGTTCEVCIIKISYFFKFCFTKFSLTIKSYLSKVYSF